MDKQIIFNNQPVNYRIQGSGPWVVLLHGFLESIEIWNDLVIFLSDRFTVLMIDLPGHGRSGLADENQSIPLVASAVRAVMASAGVDECVLCGHSMGGYVSLEVAREMPGKIKGLVLFHSHAAPDDDKAKENRNRTISIVKLNHANFIHSFIPDMFAGSNKERLAEKIERLRNRAASTSGKAIIAALAGMRDREGSLDVIMNAVFPVFFIAGKDDSRMAYEKIIAQSMLANHAEIMLLSNVGHMGMLEAPDIIFPALKHFCERCLIKEIKPQTLSD
ncbi:MAG TPA: alpha/beta hydrolase [Lentimicrobium sp.]|nr:alpha/beta hydrolase [Lentimicrobium sp.]